VLSSLPPNGGEIIVRFLETQGVERLFCVPGESYLPVLDALQSSSIDTVLARQEGGAAMMAEADGKLTGRPGIVLATRGPGATNASAGVHIAQQDSTPLMLLVGQVARDTRGRDAFQEVDFCQMFGGMAKYVEEVDDVARLVGALEDGFRIAMEGRPGPVVISLPEDMLYDRAAIACFPEKIEIAHPPPKAGDIGRIKAMLAESKQPIIIAGGPLWDGLSVAMLERFALGYDVPVVCSFRRQRVMSATHPYYAGDLGLGCNPKLIERIKASDLVLVLGGRLSEIPSQSYRLFDIPIPEQPFVHIHSDALELGRVYTPSLGVTTDPRQFLEAMLGVSSGLEGEVDLPCPEHLIYQDWTNAAPAPDSAFDSSDYVNMAEIMFWLRENLPREAIITNGAGNYATWLHRYYHFRHYQSQLAPTSGSMGYGVPAAIAAKSRFPDRPVLAFAGDGCFQMSMQELATARQIGANIMVIVVDNGMYGTIRMHQEIRFPGRTKHTNLINPNFVQVGEALGFHSEKVTKTSDFEDKFKRCMDSGKPSLIHLVVDPEAISPTKTLSELRQTAS
jgi:acetolactate synthase-1/2/3 large subunit